MFRNFHKLLSSGSECVQTWVCVSVCMQVCLGGFVHAGVFGSVCKCCIHIYIYVCVCVCVETFWVFSPQQWVCLIKLKIFCKRMLFTILLNQNNLFQRSARWVTWQFELMNSSLLPVAALHMHQSWDGLVCSGQDVKYNHWLIKAIEQREKKRRHISLTN